MRLFALVVRVVTLVLPTSALAESRIQVSPAEFEVALAVNDRFAVETLQNMTGTLNEASPAGHAVVLEYLTAATLARIQRWAKKGAPWGDTAVNEILSLAFIDPNRFFTNDTRFQTIILNHLPNVFESDAPRGLQLRLLRTLGKVPVIQTDTLEEIARRTGLAFRTSNDRELEPSPSGWQIDDDGLAPIASMLLSLPSSMFSGEDCEKLLASLKHHCPDTGILVLGDSSMLEGFQPGIIDPWVPGLTPWLRDPILVARDSDNQLTLLSRTLRQAGREDDRQAARQFVSAAPDEWDQAIGPLHWSDVDFPFHGGQLLFTPEAVWISVHSLEWRLLQLLKTNRIDPHPLLSPEGWADFKEAVQQASTELGALCGREVRFVHPWPAPPPGMSHGEFVDTLAGGNDMDLDTLITILTHPDGITFVVGDTARGAVIASSTGDSSWRSFAKNAGIALEPGELRTQLTAAQGNGRITGIQRFLDLIEDHCSAQGLRTRRTPLLMVPTALVTQHPRLSNNQPHDWFPLGCCNVVIESTPTPGLPLRAQAFSTGLPEFDQAGRKTFEAADCALILHPPLMESIICGGGFRCATQQIRQRSN